MPWIISNSIPITNYLPSLKASFCTPVRNVKMLNDKLCRLFVNWVLRVCVCVVFFVCLFYQCITVAQNQIWQIINWLGELQVKRMLHFYLGTDYNHQTTKESRKWKRWPSSTPITWPPHPKSRANVLCTVNPTASSGGPLNRSFLSLSLHFFKAHIFSFAVRSSYWHLHLFNSHKWTLSTADGAE